MSKSQILMGAGALVLTAAGVFAGRASTKFINAPGLYFSKAGVCTAITTAVNTVKLTTGAVTGAQLTMKTVGGTLAPIFAENLCTKVVHFKP